MYWQSKLVGEDNRGWNEEAVVAILLIAFWSILTRSFHRVLSARATVRAAITLQ
jgi:hypothetical protein